MQEFSKIKVQRQLHQIFVSDMSDNFFDLECLVYVLLAIGLVALKIWIGLQDLTKTIFFDDIHILDIEAQTQTGQTTIETAHEV